MTPKPKRSFLRSLGAIFLMVLIGLGLVWWQRDWLYDWARLHGYTPSAEAVRLADEATMTDAARHLYYVNHPEIRDKSNFSSICPSGTEQSVVLGCYKGGQRGIYLLDVTNPELAGIEQVTAAHEMLHAAYDRLSASEKDKVDAQLQDYYQHHLTDETIKETIEEYKKTEPDDLVNEMHSIFGTQITDLPADLNTYYSRYFTNRSKLTAYYEGYQQAFTSRQQQIKQYDDQLSDWKTQIDQLQKDVDAAHNALQKQRNELTRLRNNGDYTGYNAGVSDYNASVNAYNAQVKQLQSLIAQYNETVNKRNAIAFEERSLVQSLSSSASTE